MRNSFEFVVSFTAWKVSDMGPLVLEFLDLWNQVSGREPLHLYRKNTPIIPITLEKRNQRKKIKYCLIGEFRS